MIAGYLPTGGRIPPIAHPLMETRVSEPFRMDSVCAGTIEYQTANRDEESGRVFPLLRSD